MSSSGKVSVLHGPEVERRLASWLSTQLPEVDSIAIEGLDSIEFGHSAEMLICTVISTTGDHVERREIVIRLRPPSPGLLEPYDLRRQFTVLKALEATPVRAPRALWIEESGEVLGRPFLVMGRLEGKVIEREMPAELAAAPERVYAMAISAIEQLAQIHLVEAGHPSLHSLAAGDNHLADELDFWGSEMARWQKGPLPMQERVLDELRRQCPEPTPRVTLVHGDPKSGNFAFVGDEVSAVFDWEMAMLGDPMMDIGWLEATWALAYPFSILTSAQMDELLAHYAQLSGIKVHDRPWYRAMQIYKMGIIQLVGSMLFDAGHSDDPRLAEMGYAIRMITPPALEDLGIEEDLEWGPVLASKERRATLKAPVVQ